MEQTLHKWLVVTLMILMGLPATARAAEWPKFGPIKMEALLDYDQWKRQTDNFTSDEYDLRAGISIAGGGFWLDPGILKFNFYIEPLFTHGKYSSISKNSESGAYQDDRRGDFLNYNLGIDVLYGTTLPVYGSINFQQISTTNRGSFGRRSETDLQLNSLLVLWKNTYFPLTFKFEDRDLFSVSLPGTGRTAFIRDDAEQVYSLKGKSSKTYMELEHRTLDDRVRERNNDFDISRAILRHRLEWGSDSDLISRFKFYDRIGFNPVERIEISELAKIQHGEDFISETRYDFRSAKQNYKSTSHTGSFRLTHYLYRNLITSGFLSAEDIQSDQAGELQYQSGLRFAYQKSDFYGATVSVRAAGAYSINDRESMAGFQDIVDESHLVPLTGEVILDNRFIALGTIVVTDVTSTVVYIEGTDYSVLSITDNLTQLFALPGGRILSGDLILVSYQAEILPSVKYSAISTTVGFNYRLGWFGFSYFDTGINYDLISGAGGSFLFDTRDTNTRMDLIWDTTRTSNQFSAERRTFRNGAFNTTTNTVNQSTSLSLSPNVLLNLNLTGSRSESDLEDADLYIVNVNLTWRPTPYWTIRPLIGGWKRTADRLESSGTVDDEEIFFANLNLMWSYRKINLDLNFSHNERTSTGGDYRNDNVHFTLRRRF